MEWLSDMLHAFNAGDIDKFNSIVAGNEAAFNAQPALAHKKEDIKQKITLLCVVELLFQRPANDRTVSFKEIAEAIRLPLTQVGAVEQWEAQSVVQSPGLAQPVAPSLSGWFSDQRTPALCCRWSGC
jgi:hypothetical protein